MPHPHLCFALAASFTWLMSELVFAGAPPIWIHVREARAISPLMIWSTDVGLAEPEAMGEFLVPAVMATADKPAPDSWADFTVEVPKDGVYYLWGRLQYPTGAPESFLVTPAGLSTSESETLVLGGSGVGVRQWHWDSRGAGPSAQPGSDRLKFMISAGKWTFRVSAYRASATVYAPLQWRQADLTCAPRLNLFCLTDDPAFVPTDDQARLALNHTPSSPIEPRVTTSPLLPADQLLAGDRRQLPDWMRCPRWFTKDSWREELATRHPGDITRLVRHVASNQGVALRLSCYWGGEAYFQSRIAPHAPGLGDLDYLREAMDEAAATGVKVIVYMNPNALYRDHPLFADCAVRGPDGQISPQPTYGGTGSFVDTRHVCINHPAYRRFLRDVLTEIFTRYQPAGLYVDGLTPHVCFCEHCRAKWRQLFGSEMPSDKLGQIPAHWTVWAEMGRAPQPVGDAENDPDARRLTEMLHRSLIEMTHEVSRAVKQAKPDAVTAFHSHPKPGTDDDYDATLTEVYLTHPWVHSAWRSGELAGYSAVYHVPVLFNVYPHRHFTAAEARYHALQGLANGAYPNFWSALGMQPVFDFMARSAAELDFDTTTPVKFLALPRDLHVSDTQAQAPVAAGVAYARRDRFLAPYVGAYSALMRSGLPIGTLHRPYFEEQLAGFRVLVLANAALMSDAQVEAVRQFVRAGGGLIATHETSICDEHGARRADFGLADVLGVKYITTREAATRFVQLNEQHPVSTGVAAGGLLVHDEPLVVAEAVGAEAVGWHMDAAQHDLSVPAVLIHQYGQGRVVFLPGRFDAMQCTQVTPEIEQLFARAVRWCAQDELPIDVVATGTVAVTLFRQPNRLIAHLINHQRDTQLRSDTCAPISNVTLRIAVPDVTRIQHVRRLWEDRELSFRVQDEAVLVEIGRLEEYEAVAVEW